jgi:hypothetical protein
MLYNLQQEAMDSEWEGGERGDGFWMGREWKRRWILNEKGMRESGDFEWVREAMDSEWEGGERLSAAVMQTWCGAARCAAARRRTQGLHRLILWVPSSMPAMMMMTPAVTAASLWLPVIAGLLLPMIASRHHNQSRQGPRPLP